MVLHRAMEENINTKVNDIRHEPSSWNRVVILFLFFQPHQRSWNSISRRHSKIFKYDRDRKAVLRKICIWLQRSNWSRKTFRKLAKSPSPASNACIRGCDNVNLFNSKIFSLWWMISINLQKPPQPYQQQWPENLSWLAWPSTSTPLPSPGEPTWPR